jgi:thiamine biosynthesis lipoprotein
MKQTRIIMGMPITVEVIDEVSGRDFESVFTYFISVDKRYSTYKSDSEISDINRGLPKSDWSQEMRLVLDLCEQTKQLTNGYFDIRHNGKLDPSGLVKGWAIKNAAELILNKGAENFYIEAGGDIQVHGTNADSESWAVGIRNPFNIDEVIKVISLTTEGVATSGTYIRGEHIYNPHNDYKEAGSIKSLTVIGKNVYEADRFATAAFAMGADGIAFIESMPDIEGYVAQNA